MSISCKIDVTKILKDKLFKGAKGTYLDITLIENRDGTDQYGNDYFIVQDLGKDARERGEKGPILGNAKIRGGKHAPVAPKPAAPAAAPRQENIDEDVPF